MTEDDNKGYREGCTPDKKVKKVWDVVDHGSENVCFALLCILICLWVLAALGAGFSFIAWSGGILPVLGRFAALNTFLTLIWCAVFVRRKDEEA